MSKPKQIESYPPQILELAMEVASGKTVSIKNPSKKILESLRFSFYGFRKAVAYEKAEAVYPKLNQITVMLNPCGKEWELLFMHVDMTPAAQALQQALSEMNREPASQAQKPQSSHDSFIDKDGVDRFGQPHYGHTQSTEPPARTTATEDAVAAFLKDELKPAE